MKNNYQYTLSKFSKELEFIFNFFFSLLYLLNYFNNLM